VILWWLDTAGVHGRPPGGSWATPRGCDGWGPARALSLNAAAIANPRAPMIAKSPMQIPAIRAAVPRMNTALAYPVIHWSSRPSPPTTRNARTAMTRPKRMDARRARSAGDKTLMAALYEFTNLRELVGRVGLVQRSARSGEQHEQPRTRQSNVWYLRQPGNDMLRLSSSQFDPFETWTPKPCFSRARDRLDFA
jgi:hypothetical protein